MRFRFSSCLSRLSPTSSYRLTAGIAFNKSCAGHLYFSHIKGVPALKFQATTPKIELDFT